MNEHDVGRLRAYLDGELSPEARAAVAAHIDRCARCAEEAGLLGSRADTAQAALAVLGAAGSDSRAALARFQTRQPAAPAPRFAVRNVVRRVGEMNRSIFGPRWRPAMIAVSALLLVAILFTIAPVRDAAADFLSLFRIRKFAVIPLNQQQMDRLANLATTTRDAFGEPQILREPGPIQTVASAEQASALAGYRVRAVSRLPDGASIDTFFVEAGPLMRFEINRAAVELALQAAGLTTTGLPQAEKIVFDVDVANMVTQEYNLRKGEGAGFNRLTFVQVPSPQVNLPDGIDPVALAETGFMFLGMPQEDAQRLANSIDWTSTLVVPLPAESAQAREVTVDGVTGLLLLDVDNGRKDNALLWEKDGILHFMAAGNTDEKLLLDLANSLQ